MKTYLFVLKDAMTQAWSKVSCDQMAPGDVLEGYRRHIIKALNSKDPQMITSAGMLKGNVLYCVGEFDDVTGDLTTYNDKVLVGDLTDFFTRYAIERDQKSGN